MPGSDQIGKIVHFRAGDSHRALHHLAFRLNAPPDECGVHTVKSQAANPRAQAISFKQSRDPCRVIAARLDKACDDHAVRSPQPEDRHVGTRTTPAFSAGRYHLLAQNSDLAGRDVFDRANDFTDHFDAVRGQRAVGLTQRQNARDLPNPQRCCGGRRTIDQYRYIRRIADAFAVDENASEPLDHPNDACAANATVVVAADDAGPPDASIVGTPDLRQGRARSSEPKSNQQQPARDHRLLRHD
jgi:hypothetical protein